MKHHERHKRREGDNIKMYFQKLECGFGLD